MIQIKPQELVQKVILRDIASKLSIFTRKQTPTIESSIETPFVQFNGESVSFFVYGSSEYGGEDIIAASNEIRTPRTYLSVIK